MTEPLEDIRDSDDAVTALAGRCEVDQNDPVLRALSAWTRAIDSHPVPALALSEKDAGSPRQGAPVARVARWAAGLTAVLMVSSTGIAAATTGNPWTPIRYVTREFYALARQNPGTVTDWTVRGGRFDSNRGSGSRESRSLDRPPLQLSPHEARHRHGPNRSARRATGG